MTETKKMVNPELLRMISMLMVIVLHLFGKSGLLVSMTDAGNPNVYIAWGLEALSIVAVNVYMLISGYFLVKSNFRTGRLLSLVAQVLFYTVGITAIVSIWPLPGQEPLTTYDFVQNLLPIHMSQYWFITSYVLMYLFSPILAIAVRNMKQKQLGIVIIFLLIYESVFKSILPVVLESDGLGYDAIWYIMVFLVAAYIRLYGIRFLKRPRNAILLYLISTVLIFAEEFILQWLSVKTGRLTLLVGVSFHYNHFLVLAASIGLFTFFLNSKQITGVIGKIVLLLSPMSLGVYLLHEQIYIRYEWQKIFGAKDLLTTNPLVFFLSVIGIALCVYAVGTVVDSIRRQLFRLFGFVFDRLGVNKKLEKLDDTINGKTD